MASIERITKITEEIWHDMCGEGSSYEANKKTVLPSSPDVSDDDGTGEDDKRSS